MYKSRVNLKQLFFRRFYCFHLIKIEILDLSRTLCTCYTMGARREYYASDHAGEDVTHYWRQIATYYRERSKTPPRCSILSGKVIISHKTFCIEITRQRHSTGVMNVILMNNNIVLPIILDSQSTWILVNDDIPHTHILAVTFLTTFCRIVKKVHNNV
jgi:hypothetical protein